MLQFPAAVMCRLFHLCLSDIEYWNKTQKKWVSFHEIVKGTEYKRGQVAVGKKSSKRNRYVDYISTGLVHESTVLHLGDGIQVDVDPPGNDGGNGNDVGNGDGNPPQPPTITKYEASVDREDYRYKLCTNIHVTGSGLLPSSTSWNPTGFLAAMAIDCADVLVVQHTLKHHQKQLRQLEEDLSSFGQRRREEEEQRENDQRSGLTARDQKFDEKQRKLIDDFCEKMLTTFGRQANVPNVHPPNTSPTSAAKALNLISKQNLQPLVEQISLFQKGKFQKHGCKTYEESILGICDAVKGRLTYKYDPKAKPPEKALNERELDLLISTKRQIYQIHQAIVNQTILGNLKYHIPKCLKAQLTQLSGLAKVTHETSTSLLHRFKSRHYPSQLISFGSVIGFPIKSQWKNGPVLNFSPLTDPEKDTLTPPNSTLVPFHIACQDIFKLSTLSPEDIRRIPTSTPPKQQDQHASQQQDEHAPDQQNQNVPPTPIIEIPSCTVIGIETCAATDENDTRTRPIIYISALKEHQNATTSLPQNTGQTRAGTLVFKGSHKDHSTVCVDCALIKVENPGQFTDHSQYQFMSPDDFQDIHVGDGVLVRFINSTEVRIVRRHHK